MLAVCLVVVSVIGIVIGQSPCDQAIRSTNQTHLRQKRNTTTGIIEAYSDQILFYDNGTFIEQQLQTGLMTIGEYRVETDKNEQSLCFLERRYPNASGVNQTDCETLTVTARSNSIEGAEGCEIYKIQDMSGCYKSCRDENGGLITEVVVAYIINNKIKDNSSFERVINSKSVFIP